MEKTIDRKTVLRNTLWGADIYCHILRKFYPEETVMKISGRDAASSATRSPEEKGR